MEMEKRIKGLIFYFKGKKIMSGVNRHTPTKKKKKKTLKFEVNHRRCFVN
jgi:hypothetical protein